MLRVQHALKLAFERACLRVLLPKEDYKQTVKALQNVRYNLALVQEYMHLLPNDFCEDLSNRVMNHFEYKTGRPYQMAANITLSSNEEAETAIAILSDFIQKNRYEEASLDEEGRLAIQFAGAYAAQAAEAFEKLPESYKRLALYAAKHEKNYTNVKAQLMRLAA